MKISIAASILILISGVVIGRHDQQQLAGGHLPQSRFAIVQALARGMTANDVADLRWIKGREVAPQDHQAFNGVPVHM